MSEHPFPLSKDELLAAYTTMQTIREFEERLHVEFATGDIPGFVHLYAGEEASEQASEQVSEQATHRSRPRGRGSMTNPQPYYDVIKRPLMTEKTTNLQELRNQYFFEVHTSTNKSEVRKAVETLFDVKVKKVNILNMPAKYRRVLGRPGRTAPWKKAIVTLHDGQTIDLA